MTRGRAFTVFEVLLALSLIALLVGSVFSLIAELGHRRTLAVAQWREARGADALLDRLERDLAGAIAGDARLGAGVLGGPDHLAVLTRGVWLADAGPGVPPPEVRDLTRAEYVVEGGGMVYREKPLSRDSAAGVAERSGVLLAGGPVARFRYFDGREWTDRYDSLATGALPLAVEVAIWASTPLDAGTGGGVGGMELRRPEPVRLRVIAIPDARPVAGEGRGGAAG